MGASWAAVAPLVVGHGLEMPLIEIPLVEGVFVAMLAKVDAFWTMVAEGREPHPDYGRDGEVIEAIYGDGNAENEIDLSADNRIRELVAVRAMHRAAITHAHKMADEIDAEVKAKLGSAHVAHLGQGQRISWRPSRREGFFVAPSTVRTLRYPTEKD